MAAKGSATAVLRMTEAQMVELESSLYAGSQRFQSFEATMFDRLDEVARLNGISVDDFRAMREQLMAEYESARERGDLVGMAEIDALRAYNLRRGMEAAGADEQDIRQARAEEAAREQAYFDAVALRARQAAQAQGMTGDSLADYVQGAVEQAQERLPERKERYTVDRDARFENAFRQAGFEVEDVTENAPPPASPVIRPEGASVTL